MKLESINSTTFSLGGLHLKKGEYFPHYETPSFSPATGLVVDGLDAKVQLFKKDSQGVGVLREYTRVSRFLDSNGLPYASLSAFSADLMVVIEGDGQTSGLVSDKGVVTQITSLATGVTLDNLNGQITTVATALLADTSSSFIVTNSKVLATSTIVLGVKYTGAGIVNAQVVAQSAGQFTIKLTNVGTVALNDVIVVSFLVA